MYNSNITFDLKVLLQSLNLRKLKEHSNYFTASCPSGNHPDKDPSWVVYKNTGVHKCFSCGFRGNVEHLVKYLTGKSIYEYLNLGEQETYLFKESLTHEFSTFNRNIDIQISGELYSVYNFPEVLYYLRSRKISDRIINDFNIKYAHKEVYINKTLYMKRVCIPIYENNKLINVEGRDITKKQFKKVIYCKEGKSDTLFNIDNLDFNKPLYLVEGILDTVQIYDNISKNVTCTFGVSLSSNQRKLIPKIKHLIVIPDADDGGKRFLKLIDEIYTNNEYYIVQLPEGEDPNSVSLMQLLKAIDNKVLSIDYWIEESKIFESQEISWEGL